MKFLPFIFVFFGVYFYANGRPLEGKKLKIVTIDAPPFVFTYGGSTEHPIYRGFLIDTLKKLQETLGFEYEIYRVPDGKYGYRDTGGEWKGMVGELVHGKADMALAPLTITPGRESVVRFGTPFMAAGLVPVIKTPKAGEKLPFWDMHDLVQNKDIQYGVLGKGSTFQFFRHNSHPLFESMGSYMNCHPEFHVNNYMEAVEKSRKDKNFVFFGEEPMLSFLTGRRPCDLMIVGNSLNERYYGLAFPLSQEELVKDFNQALLEVKELGEKERLMDYWWENDCKKIKFCLCDKGISSEEQSGENATDTNYDFF